MQTTEARPAVKDENPILRVRAQAAIVRTLAAEMLRGDRGANQAEGLRNQAIEESARLVSVVEGLSRMRAAAPPAANGEPRQRSRPLALDAGLVSSWWRRMTRPAPPSPEASRPNTRC